MNTQKRIAYRIFLELSNVMNAVPRDALPYVARGVAKTYNLPAKAALQAMRRYTRLYR
jgi:hypothetical protein